MKRFLLPLITSLLLGGPALAQQPVQAIIRTLKDPKSKQVLVVAHRADWRNEPENSIRGIESAIKMGVDMVEIDLKKSKDGVLILMHDNLLDRTTSGKGRPADYTWTLNSSSLPSATSTAAPPGSASRASSSACWRPRVG